MCSQNLKVDHVTVAGRDLRAMQKALEGSGLRFQYGGPHSNHATEMALSVFPDGSYLELIAIQPKADPKAVAAHEWHKFLKGDAGPTSWAVRPANFAEEVERLRKTGISVSEPRPNGRKRPDGVELKWETAQVGVTNGTFFPFLIHDFTPRELRAFTWERTGFGGNGITKVVIAVKNLDAAIEQFQRAYSLAEPLRENDATFGASMAWFKGTPVVLAAPLSRESWLRERLARFGESPCAFVLGVGDISDAPGKLFGHTVSWRILPSVGWLGYEVQ